MRNTSSCGASPRARKIFSAVRASRTPWARRASAHTAPTASQSQELGGERAHGPAIANDKDNNEMKTKGNAGMSWHILTRSTRLQRERYTAW